MALVFLANLIVGLLVGISGIAGFLLPIFYIGVMNLQPVEALALSFSAFIISGTLGSVNYYKKGLLDIKISIIISVGSFIASIFGVRANLLIPEKTMQMILYIVVLLSGLSIIFRKNRERERKIELGYGVLIIIGFITGFICSVSGAGGPILVLPILILLGVKVHNAIGISLFNSIFIGLPAAIGYMLNSNLNIIAEYISIALVAHGLGVIIGSKNTERINQNTLKKAVGVFSVGIAIYKLSKIII